MNKEILKDTIREDKDYYFGKGVLALYRRFTRNPLYRRGQYVIASRKLGYHKSGHGLYHMLMVFVYQRKKNVLGEKLHIELGPDQFGRRLRIYHNDIIVNGGVILGDDCELYGNNCIGNKGSGFAPLDAPIIGNSVSFGVGAHAIGKIRICDNTKLSSMTLVNKDITEEGIYGGIPAKLLKRS